MLVEFDAVYAPMNMNPAHRFVRLLLERSPIRVPFVPISFIAGLLVVPCFAVPDCLYISLSSCLSFAQTGPSSTAIGSGALIQLLVVLAALFLAHRLPFQLRCRSVFPDCHNDVLVNVRLFNS